MLAALTDQKSGNSTPRCSKLIVAVAPVGHDDVAALPGHLVVGVHAGRGVDALDREARALRGLALTHDLAACRCDVSVMPVSPPLIAFHATHLVRQELRCSGPVGWVLGALVRRCRTGRAGRLGGAAIRARARPAAGRSRPRSPRGTRSPGRPTRTAGRRPRRARAAARGSPGRPRGPSISAQPVARTASSTRWASSARSSSVDRPALAGLADAGEHLVPAERLGGAGALDHGQARRLDRREPAAALAGTGAGGGSRCRPRSRGCRRRGCRRAGRTGSASAGLPSRRQPGFGCHEPT